MKHDDLWNDSLDEAMPPHLAGQSLAAMQRASRQARRRRQTARVVAVGLACAIAALALWPRPRAGWPAPPVITAQLQPVPVRYLTDDEFIARVNEAGYGIVITHYDDANQVQLIPQDPGFVPIQY